MDREIGRWVRPHYWHYWISVLLGLLLAPVLRSRNLPLKFDWITLSVAYWLVLAAQSIFVAVLLSLIGLPRSQSWKPFLARYRANPLRVIPVLIFLIVLAWATTLTTALVLTIDVIALLELRDRQKSQSLRSTATAIFVPAAYLFFGFLMVLAYNNAIASVRYNFATDPALAAIDKWLLRGHSVSDLAHWAVRTFPLSFFRTLEFIYFGMFPQMGAAIILLAISQGRDRALRFVGTILMSYYLALAIFYLWPAQGPYSLCPSHFSRFPESLQSYRIQKTLIPHAIALWHQEPITRISTDYFIAFPCMHLVQPIIVIWFLRRWKPMVIALAAYDVLLLAAVLLLEMHYVIDIIAGFFVAALAIASTGAMSRLKRAEASPISAGTAP